MATREKRSIRTLLCSPVTIIQYEPYRYPGFIGDPQYYFHGGSVYGRIIIKESVYHLKAGYTATHLPDTFWKKPGDKVIESYIQACLHMSGVYQAVHPSRMAESYQLRDGITQLEMIAQLDEYYLEAIARDKRIDWSQLS